LEFRDEFVYVVKIFSGTDAFVHDFEFDFAGFLVLKNAPAATKMALPITLDLA
jgi:hypothetical protein